MVPPVFSPIQYQYRCQHPLYRLPIPVAGWPRAKPSAEFRALRRSGSRPDPRASRPSPVRFYLAAARRSARACGRPPPLPKPTVSNIPPGRSIPTPCRRRSHDRDHPRSGGGRLAPSIAKPLTSHPPGELRQAAVGHALTAGETETPHPGRRNTICVPAASSNPNHGAPQPTRFAVTSLPCAPKMFCFSRLVSSDCGTSKTGRVGSRAEEACGTKSVVSGIPS